VGQMDRKKVARYLRNEMERIRQDPMRYGHRLHKGQETIASNESRRKIVVCGNRWGKSEYGMREVLWRARGNHPYRDLAPHSMIWVGAPDYPSYTRFHKPAFDRWCPPSWIVGQFHTTEKWVDIRRLDGGICRIFFLSYDMPRTKWQGAGVDFIWLDEEMPEDLVKECLARIVTTQGSILLTFTPVSGVGWWFSSLWQPARKGQNRWWPYQAGLATRDEANEAEFEIGQSLVPHLTRAQIIEFASEYPDPDERAIRVFGEVKGRTGLVYKGYRADVHRVPPFRVPDRYELWGAVDPGYHGFAAIIAAVSPGERVYVVDEMFSQQQTTRDRFRALAGKARQLLPKNVDGDPEPRVVVFWVDTEDPQVVLELNTQAALAAEEDAKQGLRPVHLAFASLDQGLKARKAGFLRVQQQLAQAENRAKPEVVARERHPQGEPMLYFFDDLYSEWQGEDRFYRESRVLWELERYSWKRPAKTSPTIQPDDADENSAGGAHMMASLRYLIMSRIGPPDAPEEPREGTHADIWDQVDQLHDEMVEGLEDYEP
jgi:phage terminase large subunit-like protein